MTRLKKYLVDKVPDVQYQTIVNLYKTSKSNLVSKELDRLPRCILNPNNRAAGFTNNWIYFI